MKIFAEFAKTVAAKAIGNNSQQYTYIIWDHLMIKVRKLKD